MAKKILIVDDDVDDLNTVRLILEKSGYGAVPATNGAKALDMLKGNGFDLILLDVRMPTLSGYDLLRLLRERLNHHVKIAYVTIVPKEEVDLDGIDGFVQKPFSPATLLSEVKKMLK